MTIGELDEAARKKFDIAKDVSGVVVNEVAENSAAAERGIVAGEVITEIAQESVSTPQQVLDRISALKEQGRKNALLMLASKIRRAALRDDPHGVMPAPETADKHHEGTHEAESASLVASRVPATVPASPRASGGRRRALQMRMRVRHARMVEIPGGSCSMPMPLHHGGRAMVVPTANEMISVAAPGLEAEGSSAVRLP